MYKSNESELEILKYWDEHKCFEKSISEKSEDKPYYFYDGPPFATGLPHYGHIVASLMKDVVPRYFTMRGFRVERKWGWDCHGLPVENIIEKDLNLKTKQDIENYGVANFNNACQATVLKYTEEWKKTIKRMGRWVDMENNYKTMDIDFMESVWWVFEELWKKNLIYKGHKAMHICPRCATPLSNFEVTDGYKDIEDISVTTKFKLEDNQKDFPQNTFVLAWTTTPWTLPGNVLLAIGKDIQYVLVKKNDSNESFILAQNRLRDVFKNYQKENFSLKELKTEDVLGLKYQPLFSYYADTNNAFRVVDGDFVTTTDGTGVVHIAPAFGEDDYNVGKRENVPLVQHVGIDGRFKSEVTDFAGINVKPKENPKETDEKIIEFLKNKGLVFSEEKFTHSYPHCWRCETPLLNYATSSWFVKVSEIKDLLIANNKKINWVPEHIKEGRFGLWLENARDWAISRNRYWGTPLPIWESEDGETICVGSVDDLEKISGIKVENLHKHIIDEIIIKKDGKEFKRIPEVLDCWFESGSMPYGQMHYPFENKEKFEKGFPAEFIAEGQDQTRGWFYTLHILATALTMGENPSIKKKETVPAFKNVIVNGIVLAEDGKKMSKRLKNYPEPEIVLEKYGADAMRYYFITSPVMESENLNFSENGVKEIYNRVINTLWNIVDFYKIFSSEEIKSDKNKISENVLDKWIIAKLNALISTTTTKMEEYKLIDATRPIADFITDLSTWYIRRSRDRFKSENEAVREEAILTLDYVLLTLSKIIAPFMPFISENIYQLLKGDKESVHLEDWPNLSSEKIEENIISEMKIARSVVELGLSARAKKSIKVRQPLKKLVVNQNLSPDIFSVIADEINVKKIIFSKEIDEADNEKNVFNENQGIKISLDIQIDEDLKKEGMVREIIRGINQLRKESGLTIKDIVDVKISTTNKLIETSVIEFIEEIKKNTFTKEINFVDTLELGNKLMIDESEVTIQIS